jgi:DNA-binding SARP family transcriptional activator
VDGVRLRLRGREQRLVALLAVRGPMSRSAVAGTLWPEVSEERARTSVRSAVWTLSGLAPHLLTTGTELALAPDVQVDATQLLATARAVLGGTVAPDRLPLPAHELLPGGTCTAPLLASWNDDWVVVERERFEQLRLLVLDALCTWWLTRGDAVRAEVFAREAVSVDPLRESAQRRLVEVYLSAGDVAAALTQFHTFRALLADELGLSPTPLMSALVTAALHQDVPSPPRPPRPRGHRRRPRRALV